MGEEFREAGRAALDLIREMRRGVGGNQQVWRSAIGAALVHEIAGGGLAKDAVGVTQHVEPGGGDAADAQDGVPVTLAAALNRALAIIIR